MERNVEIRSLCVFKRVHIPLFCEVGSGLGNTYSRILAKVPIYHGIEGFLDWPDCLLHISFNDLNHLSHSMSLICSRSTSFS